MATGIVESATGGRSQRPPDGTDARSSRPAAWPHEEWKLLSFYEKFEQCVALVLVALISLVIVSALYRLALKVLATLLEAADPTDPACSRPCSA